MAPPLRLAAISVDIDEVPCYTAIHGLDAPTGKARRAIYERALPRLAKLFADEKVPCTFFAIGRDLNEASNGQALRDLSGAGHEIANHSLNHLYDLTKRDLDTLRREVAGGRDAIERAVGEAPAGFRAPGYTMSGALFDVLQCEGVTYDSSVFPCPVYYAAKAGAIGLIRLRGRQSHSIIDDPRVLTAPADPYRVGRPYWRRGQRMLELPIGVTRDVTGRLPFIGTSLVLSSPRAARTLTQLIAGRSLVNLELHGMDLADAELDGLGFLAPHQPDLRRSAEVKERSLRAAIGTLREAGYQFVTLGRAAAEFGARLPSPSTTPS